MCVYVCLCVLYVGVSKLASLCSSRFMLSFTCRTYTRVIFVEFVLAVNQTIQPAKSNKSPLVTDRCESPTLTQFFIQMKNGDIHFGILVYILIVISFTES